MTEQPFEIACALCSCHFSAEELDEDEILCQMCGHSLDDDHASVVIESEQSFLR